MNGPDTQILLFLKDYLSIKTSVYTSLCSTPYLKQIQFIYKDDRLSIKISV